MCLKKKCIHACWHQGALPSTGNCMRHFTDHSFQSLALRCPAFFRQLHAPFLSSVLFNPWHEDALPSSGNCMRNFTYIISFCCIHSSGPSLAAVWLLLPAAWSTAASLTESLDSWLLAATSERRGPGVGHAQRRARHARHVCICTSIA